MKTLRFEGFSDDTFGETTRGPEHDNCASMKPIIFKVWSESAKDGLFVTGQYCPGPSTGWMIGISRLSDDDSRPIPNWPMRFEHGEKPYSPSLVIEAPDDAIITLHGDTSNEYESAH